MERVSESLLAELTGGVLAPGMPLAPEAELAERLGVRTWGPHPIACAPRSREDDPVDRGTR
jgi:hypothetical protein